MPLTEEQVCASGMWCFRIRTGLALNLHDTLESDAKCWTAPELFLKRQQITKSSAVYRNHRRTI
jgi:hypothetical protein